MQVHQLEVGDLVRVMKDKTTALHFQKGHGGWSKNQDLVGSKGCIYVITQNFTGLYK